MPISGIVIVLDERAGAVHAALEMVRADARFTVGPAGDSDGGNGDRVAAVLETTSDAESRERLEWLEAMPGVALVQIAYVDCSDIEAGRETGGGCAHDG